MYSTRPAKTGSTRTTSICAPTKANTPAIGFGNRAESAILSAWEPTAKPALTVPKRPRPSTAFMMSSTLPDTGTRVFASRLRCIQCGAVADRADQNFRCRSCGDLYEVFFPGWETPHGLRAAGLKAGELKKLWRDRKLLPSLTPGNHPITLREGNTPLYELPRSARAAGLQALRAKHQGMNPTASFKDTGMTTAA